MGYAFISYSSKNQSAADAMRKLLDKNGIASWMAPGDIPPASNYATEITKAIRECTCFVLLLSNDAQNSPHVDTETERAKNYHKSIFCIQLEDVVLNDSFEYYLSTQQMIRANGIHEHEPEIQRLINQIKEKYSEVLITANKNNASSSSKKRLLSQKTFLIYTICISLLAFLSGIILITNSDRQEKKRALESNYDYAVKLMESKEYDKACDAFLYAGDMGYKGAYERAGEPLYLKAEELLAANDTVGACCYFYLAGNYSDSVLRYMQLKEKYNIIIVGRYAVCINDNGTVSVGGKNVPESIDVSNWENIVSIAPSSNFIVALKRDGTLLATGNNEYGQCNVDNWNNIQSICTTGTSTIGLKADGSVIITGNNDYGQNDVLTWSDIDRIYIGYGYIMGLKRDGSVVAAGNNEHGQCDVAVWQDIDQIFPDTNFALGLKKDKTVVVAGENKYIENDISDWTGIVDISIGSNHTIALRQDGTVIATGSNSDGQCNVKDWKNICQIDTYGSLSIGMRADGSLVTTGSAPEAWLIN